MSKFDDMLEKYIKPLKNNGESILTEELSISDKNKIVDIADNFVEVVTAKIIQDGRAKNSTSKGYEVSVKDNTMTIVDPLKIGSVSVSVKSIIEVDNKVIEIVDANTVTSVMDAIHSQLRSLNNKTAEKAPEVEPAEPEAVEKPDLKAQMLGQGNNE